MSLAPCFTASSTIRLTSLTTGASSTSAFNCSTEGSSSADSTPQSGPDAPRDDVGGTGDPPPQPPAPALHGHTLVPDGQGLGDELGDLRIDPEVGQRHVRVAPL